MDSKDGEDLVIKNPNNVSGDFNEEERGNNITRELRGQSGATYPTAQISMLRRESTFIQKKMGPLGLNRLRSGKSKFNQSDRFASLLRKRVTGDMQNGISFHEGVKDIQMQSLSSVTGNEEKEETSHDSVPQSKHQTKKRTRFEKLWRATLHQSTNSVDELDANGLASLHLAAQCGQVSLIEELLLQGADINVKTAVDGATPLSIATRYNRVKASEVLLRYDADVRETLSNGQTPMHIACRKGNVQIAEMLVKHWQPIVNTFDKDRTTPLHQAAMMGDVSLCKLLVEHKANIRAKDINDVTPLMQASLAGYGDFVQYLMSFATQSSFLLSDYLNDTDAEGNTSLHLAVGNRHIDVARVLIDRGASVNARKDNGYSALHQAAITGEVVMVEMLIDKGAQTEVSDDEQMTPLHKAALYNRVDTILLLIRQGLFLNAQDEDNFTPLLSAAWKGRTDAGRALLRYGGDIKAQDRHLKTCLHWAVELQHTEFVKMLFEDGHEGKSLLDWQDRSDQTALHYAAEVGNDKLVFLLIEHGATVDVKDVEERTPLHMASENGHLECLQHLLQACPVPLNDDDIDDMTPLLLASQNGHHRVVNYLIQMGADIASRNDNRRTALALAALNDHQDVMAILLDNHADVNTVDKNKDTPLHLCAREGHCKPATLLLTSGADVSLKNNHKLYPLDVAIESKHEVVAEAILSSKSWEIALNNRDEYDKTPITRLIRYLPEAMMMVMNQCVTRSHDDKHHKDLEITYNYKYLDPGPDDPSTVKQGRQYALEAMVTWDREKLLEHELTQSLLLLKWAKFARYFHFFDFILYVMFISVTYFYLGYNLEVLTYGDWSTGCPHEPNNTDLHSIDTSENADGVKETNFTNPLVIFFQFFIVSYIAIKFIREVMDAFITKFNYLVKVENWAHWFLYISMFIFIWPPYAPPCDYNWAWGAMAIFQAWMNFIFILQRFDFFGLYVAMFWTTLRSLLKAMVVYIFFIVGFALAFRIIFAGKHPGFRDDYNAITTTFVMTLGEINKSDLFDTGIDLYPFEEVGIVLFVAFLFLMPMVLINLTIGISVGDIESIMRTAYLQRFSQQIDNIIDIEKRFPVFIQRKLWIETKSHYPNRKRPSVIQRFLRFFLGSESAADFLSPTRGEAKVVTEEQIFAEILRHEEILKNLSTMLQNQESLLTQQGDVLRRIADKNGIRD